MRLRFGNWRWFLGIALLTGVSPLSAQPSAQSAKELLLRMERAAHGLNYDGTFVYSNGQWLESMRIVHRVDQDGERERLVSLTGSAREVLRDGQSVRCVLPEIQSVLMFKRKPRVLGGVLLLGNMFEDNGPLWDNYSLVRGGSERIASRIADVVLISAKDQFRYGYRLFIDRKTGLLLKSDLLDGRNSVLEQILYTQLNFPDLIPDASLESELTGESFTELTGEDTQTTIDQGTPGWQVNWLPSGFQLQERSFLPGASGEQFVEHLVYSDGLASLSIFIEALHTGIVEHRGLSSIGALIAFGRVEQGFQVTVVGEVPSFSVEQVAASVTRN